MSLITLVSYCSYEREFIDRLLQGALLASDHVCLAYGNRLYDGSPENLDDIKILKDLYPTVIFTMYDVPDHLLKFPVMLHNLARKCAFSAACTVVSAGGISISPTPDFWVLMLDGDEIPRQGGLDLLNWRNFNITKLDKAKGYKFSTFWYFLLANLISQGEQDSMVMVHASVMTDIAMSSSRERDGICYELIFSGGDVVRNIHGLNNVPMFDHFAWVRGIGRVGLLKKVANWGHSTDKNWVGLINDAFDGIEKGVYPETDFIHGWKMFRINYDQEIPDEDFYVYKTRHL